MKFQVMFNFLL